MIKSGLMIASSAVFLVGTAFADENRAVCVADVKVKAKAFEGIEITDEQAGAFCDCLLPQIAADPDVMSVIQSNKGIPAPGTSAELDGMINSCR